MIIWFSCTIPLSNYSHVDIACVMATIIAEEEGLKKAVSFFQDFLTENPSLYGLNYLSNLYCQLPSGDESYLSTIDLVCCDLRQKGCHYLCSQCGLMSKSLYWLCPGCHHWSTSRPVVN